MNPPATVIASPPSPVSSSDKQSAEQEFDFSTWADRLLLPPHFFKILHPDYVDKSAANKKGGDPFFSVPGFNFCCAETSTGGLTKASDDDSHSTISEENNPEVEATPVAKPATESNAFQTWEDFFADFNVCGRTFVDGLPPTIDVAMPITKVTEEAQVEAGAASIVLDESRNNVLEPTPDPEEDEGKEKIVIYYPESGVEETKEDLVEKEPTQTVVRVALDPAKQDSDDPILQERARAESAEQAAKSPDGSLSNVESTSTGAIVPSSVRFQNLATGSFCEISSVGDDDDTPEELLLKKAACVDLPLVDEEEDESTEASTEHVSVQGENKEVEDAQQPSLKEETPVENTDAVAENIEALKEETDKEDAENGDLQEANSPEDKEQVQEVLDLENDQKENEEDKNEEEGKDVLDTVAAAEAPAAVESSGELTPQADLEVEEPNKEGNQNETEPSLDLESTETTVKMTSLFVGIFDSAENAN